MLNRRRYLLVTLLALMMFSSGLWPNASGAQSPLPIGAESPAPVGEPQAGQEMDFSLSSNTVTSTALGHRSFFPGLFDDVWTPSAVTQDVDGSIHFVAEIFVEGQPEVYYVKAKDDLILEIVNLSQNPSSSMHPDLYVSDTEVHVVWQDNLSGTDQIYHRWRSEGQWVAAQPITDSPSGAYAPKLIAEPDEQIKVEWIEYTQNQTDAYRCTWTGDSCAGRNSVSSLPQAPEPLSTEATEALRTLAFLRDGEIWTVQEDGSGLRRVTNSGGRVYAFAWSPGGQQFAYANLTDLEYQWCDIYIINLDGTAERRLTTNVGASRWVIDWRADKIAFLREMTEYPYVRVTSVTTNGIVTDISGDIENYGIGFDIFSHPRLRWSPDGQWVALSNGMANAVVSLGGLQRLIDEWLQPDWNKDSTHLIYDSGKIRKYYPATGSSTLLSSVAPDFPTYSPDNQYIVYGSPSLRRMNNNNTGNVSLTSDKAAFMDWSHLGDKIAYTRWYDNGTPWAGIYGVYVIGYSGSGRRQVSSGDDESPRWQPPVASYSVSGRVTTPSGSGISGVTLSTDKGQSVITDANGNYTLSGIGAGTYTVTPSRSGYAFCPGNRKIEVSSNVAGQDYTGFEANVVLGFCPNSDGYKFSNSDSSWGSFPVSAYDYRRIDLISMFGQDAVCVMTGEICWIKPQANLWHVQANLAMNSGHCDGMTSTSLRFFKGLDLPASFNSYAYTPNNLNLGDVRHHVAYYFVKQLTDPVGAYKEQVRQNTPSAILDQLRAAMQGGAPDPPTLFLRKSGEGGHAITPYAIADRGSGVSWVRVYDNNHPDDFSRYVVIDTVNQTWSYNLGGATWTGSADTKTLGVVPISKYVEQPVCPWCAGSVQVAAPDNPPMQEVWLNGSGHLLITDGLGRRLGYNGTQFVNEIPNAHGRFYEGGLGVEQEPIYKLPVNASYTILMGGKTVAQPKTITVSQFGPGYAVQIDNIQPQSSVQDSISITANGSEIAYRPSTSRHPTLSLAFDDNVNISYELQVVGAAIDAGQRVIVARDTTGRLVYSNAQADGGEYGLSVRRVSSIGTEWFTHNNLTISAGDTHYAAYRSWDGQGAMTLYVDRGSDGTIDDAIPLENQIRKVHLPLISRN